MNFGFYYSAPIIENDNTKLIDCHFFTFLKTVIKNFILKVTLLQFNVFLFVIENN